MSRRATALVVAIVGVLVVWWWWPGLTGAGDETRVALVIGGDLRTARESLDRRLREEGLRTEWVGDPESWCEVDDVASSVSDSVDVIVIAAAEGDGCEVSVDRLEAGRRVVALAASDLDALDPVGELARSLDRQGVRVVDADRLLAPIGRPTDCYWWDDCPADGGIVVLDENGLTPAGGERVARLLVAAVIE